MNAVCYGIFAAVVICQLWLFFRDRRLAWLKVILSGSIVAMIAMLAGSFTTWLGWPTAVNACQYHVLRVMLVNATPGAPGHIYALMAELHRPISRNPFAYSPVGDPPRAYEVPELFEKTMQKVNMIISDGNTVFIDFCKAGEQKKKRQRLGSDHQDVNDDDPGAPEIYIFEPEQRALKGEDD